MNSSREDVWLDARLRIGLYQVVDEIENDRVSFRRVSCNEECVCLKQTIGVNHVSVTELRTDFDVGEHCTNAQVEKLDELLRMNAGAFAQDDNDLGYTDMIRHSIRTSAETPIALPFRRIPPTQYQEVKEHIRMLLGQGVIKESHSAWTSPIVLVRKKDGSLRMCVDYRQLNAKTHRDAFPLPRIDESFDAMKGAKWFTTLDLASGHHQIAMDERDQEKTAFVTPMGIYEYTRMPFGLCNAPATFQRLMQSCLGDQCY